MSKLISKSLIQSAARIMGQAGGRVTSAAKAKAARKNGRSKNAGWPKGKPRKKLTSMRRRGPGRPPKNAKRR